jgi:predicted acylesterase/phospholipase RssA
MSCPDGQQSPRDQFFRRVVFASGSPFPVFPAHQVGNQLLVDGGYSNLVPVDAAQTVAAQAVLIVGSSSPLAPGSAAEGWWRRVPGELVRSSPQILSFLYERSQQVDRLSRPDLLVVSIAPRREEPNWPLLTDFRPSVVERMIQTAKLDLSRRVGLVQSWGRPRFGQVPASGRPPS